MGTSTDAYLFYGYCWTEYTDDLGDTDYDEDEESEPRAGLITSMDAWAEKVVIERGHVNPWDSHPGGSSPAWMADNRAALDEWHDLKKAVEDEAGVDWDSHCSGEYPMPFLCIPESKKTAYRGNGEPVTSLEVGEDWDARLAAHMEAQGFPPPEGKNQPGWWLVSYWG